MKITVLCIGKNKDRYIQEAVLDFQKKIRPLADLTFVELKESKGNLPKEKILKTEAELIRNALRPESKTILLDVKGKEYSSEQAASIMRREKDLGSGNMTFVIGGAYGVDPLLRMEMKDTWSFSPMTFSHQIMRIILLEQIYRMLTLVHGIPYHK